MVVAGLYRIFNKINEKLGNHFVNKSFCNYYLIEI
jgi:hypothetical protein